MRRVLTVLLAGCASGCAGPSSTAAPAEPALEQPAPASEGAATPAKRQTTPPAPANEENVNPDINEPYTESSDIKEWVGRFEREGREGRDKRRAIGDEIDLRRGLVVADIGAGTGLFTIEFARAVGETGKVYAVDVLQKFLDHVAKKATEAGVSNVDTIMASQKSAELPTRAIDLAFLCDAYHHLEYPLTYLASIHAALRDDGELVLIDFNRIPGKSEAWLLDHVRADKDTVIEEVEGAGFELIAKPDLLEENYFLRFKKR